MTTHKKVACGLAAAAILLGAAGSVAAAHTLGGPAVQGPAVVPADHPDSPGVVDTPEPGDTPDGPGDAPDGPGQ
jgi:hypothetical protein